MSLSYRFVSYPDELKIQGLVNNGNATTQGTQEASQASAKQAIIDICNAFVDELQMPIVPTEGELDLANVEDIPDIATYATTWNQLNFNQFFPYGFKVFAFNDDYQNTKPLYMKLTFGLKNITPKYNHTNYRHRFSFVVRISIFDHLGVELYNENYCNAEFYNTYNGYYYEGFSYYFQNVVDSVFFKADSSIFFSIYPKKKTIRNIYSNTYPSVNTSYFSFYIFRNEKFLKIIPLSRYRSWDFSTNDITTSMNSINDNIIYISLSDGYTRYNTNNNVYLPFNDRIISNNESIVFNINDIDPSSDTVYPSTDMLMGYSSKMATNSVVDVGNSKYYVYKYDVTANIIYHNHSKYALLFKVE